MTLRNRPQMAGLVGESCEQLRVIGSAPIGQTYDIDRTFARRAATTHAAKCPTVDGVPTTAHPTLLSLLVREGSWTIEETCAAFERTAQAMGEDATLSVRQLVRWMNGRVGQPRAVSRRVAEQFWGHSFEALLGPAQFTVPAVSPGGAAGAAGRNHAQRTTVHCLSAQRDRAPASPGQTLDTFLDEVRLPDGGTAAELVELSRALDQRSVGRGALTRIRV